MSRHDDDGENGHATSWAGYRLLSLDPPAVPVPPQPPVSYNAWGYRHVPIMDDIYYEDDEEMPGKYQFMSNGHFDVGETAEGNFTIASDWMSLLSNGPIPELAAGDTIKVAFAAVCAPDSASLPVNAAAIARHHANGYQVVGVSTDIPSRTATLAPPYPNPFNPGTVLQYHLTDSQPVRISIHAVDGSLVRTLVNEPQAAGNHQVSWNGCDEAGRQVASGHYMARLIAGNTRLSRGLTLLK